MYYLKVNFSNAAIVFEKGNKSTDYVFDCIVAENEKNNKWMKRTDHMYAKKTIFNMFDESCLDNIIGFEQVSNMIHVLAGERPVPTYQFTTRERLKEIDDVARNVYCKIDNLYYTTDKKGKKRPITELTQGKKWVLNANRKDLTTISSNGDVYGGDIKWSTLKQKYYYDNNELYVEVINKFKEWYDKESLEDKSLIDMILYLANERGLKDEMITFFKSKRMTPFVHIINGNRKASDAFNKASTSPITYNLAERVINTTPVYKLYLNGSFIIPIGDEKIYNAIMRGNLCCTFLEGGYVDVCKHVSRELDLQYIEEHQNYKQIFH